MILDSKFPKELEEEMIKGNIILKETQDKPDGFKEGYLISSGYMKNKHWLWIIEKPDENGKNEKTEVHDSVIKDYYNDESRKSAIDVLEILKNKNEYPIFYRDIEVKENDKENKLIVLSFGHTGFYRLNYDKKINEFIPKDISDENKSVIDIAEAIFGNEDTFSSRVFFEDAVLTDNECILKSNYIKILSNPKPTTFNHYLEQPSEAIVNKKKLKTYNDETNLRGYKLYWHRDDNWIEDKEKVNKNKKIITKITPVKEGSTFEGKIRFENLSKIELGALLFALALPEGCCHKIGMGKPHGLGSIKITPELYISKRNTRYQSLYNEIDDNTKSEDINSYKDEFSKYILKFINPNNKDLWKEERMQELNAILKFDDKPDKEKTRYFEINHIVKDENGNIIYKTNNNGQPIKDKDGKKVPKTINEFRDRKVLLKPKAYII